MVTGAGGRERPMFMGQWKDDLGEIHKKGMADLLLTPKIPVSHLAGKSLIHIPMNTSMKEEQPAFVCVALWVECKSGSGRLEPEQKLFRDDVLKAAAFYLEIHDSAEDVIEWFEQMGVRR